MRKSIRIKTIGLAVAMVCLVALVAAASSVTGAYFSDTKSGTMTGTVGSVKVDTAATNGGGADRLDLNFTNLMPGEPQTLTTKFTNIGSSAQDVWVVFPNADALHAINDLGTYGEVTVSSEEGDLFYSANLNDKSNNGTTPLPRAIRLRQNVAVGASGTMLFKFAYAGKLGTASQSSGGGVWNAYPVVGPTSAGLPYQIVATQVGQTP